MNKARHMLVAGNLVLLLVTAAMAQGPAVVEEEIETEHANLRLVQVVEGLEHPWAIAFLPDGAMLVSERPGRLQRIEGEAVTEIAGLPEIASHGQGGLLDVVPHPGYAGYESNGWIYLTYSKGDSEGTATTLMRARLDGDRLTDIEEVFTQDRRSQPGRHYGSRVAFMHDGTLVMSVGERGVEPERAQDLADHAGSLLRMNDDGSAPEDNPFAGREDAHLEIYSYGHRNIQGLVVHPETGEVWTTEHGPRGGDRFDRIQPGENYGWPVVSYGREYDTGEQWGEGRSAPGMSEPLHSFGRIAPSGLAVVTGERYPAWEGDFLAGALSGQQVRRLVVEDGAVVDEEVLLEGTIGRIRDVRMSPDGYIYLLTDARDGGVYRLEPRDDAAE